MIRANVRPEIWQWAIERVGERADELRDKFPKLGDWQSGKAKPTIRQLEAFASVAYVPFGYLFLSEPPEEPLPLQDFRTVTGRGVRRPSPDLLDVIYLCQRRQAWYRDYADLIGESRLAFVGSAKVTEAPEKVAAAMREQLGFEIAARRGFDTIEKALRQFIEQAEDAGILVMISGVVGSNNRRALDPQEFRGFALADEIAPLVFINGADPKAAQMFTLAHEIAHLWLGHSALGDSTPSATNSIEIWCNRVAAEFLVPISALKAEVASTNPLDAIADLSRVFKVSAMVILIRLLDAKLITRDRFKPRYAAEIERISAKAKSSGGNFYAAQGIRLSKRFARAIIASALEGQTPFREAFQMLGISKDRTFRELGRTLEVIPR